MCRWHRNPTAGTGPARPRSPTSGRRPTATARPTSVSDPIVEPLWVGLRALAAVDDDGRRPRRRRRRAGRRHRRRSSRRSPRSPGDRRSSSTASSPSRRPSAAVARRRRGRTRCRRWAVVRRAAPQPRRSTRSSCKEDALEARTFGDDDEVSFVATDLLWLDDTSLLDVPLLERRRLLESVLVESDLVRRRRLRPPADRDVGRLVAGPGLRGPHLQGRQQPLPPGRPHDDWAISGMPRR